MMKSITLFRGANSWLAKTMVGGVPDPEQVELFGTSTLPTAFTCQAEPGEVFRTIARLNPEARVTIDQGGAM